MCCTEKVIPKFEQISRNKNFTNTKTVMYNNRSIVLHELIGLRVKVAKCSDRKQVGIEGIVIDETKNTLVVETKQGVKKLIKKISIFKFYNSNERKGFVVDGKEINFRPYERLEKSMKFYKRRKI